MAIKVEGGTQDGVYTKSEFSPWEGKDYFVLVGHDDTGDPPDTPYSIGWITDRWIIYNVSIDSLYYSLSDVLTPDLATNWKDPIAPPKFIIDFNNLNVSGAHIYGLISGDPGIIYFNPAINLVDSLVFQVALTADAVLIEVGINDLPTKQQIITKLVLLGGGLITDLSGLKIQVAPTTSSTIAPIGDLGFVGMTGSSETSDTRAASITVTNFNIHKMNLYNLKNVCAAYHNKVVDDLTVAGVDLFLIAANNAKKGAEKLHNFELEWVKATISVDYLTGGLFSSATTVPANTFSGLKEILSVSGTVNNCVVPIRFTRPKGVPQSYDWNLPRYPTDSQVMSSGSSCPFGLVFRGDSIVIYPTQTSAGTLPITVEGYGWLNDYDTDQVADEDADSQDFLLAYGFDFLQWSIIIELNYVFQTFVNRQEGNVGTPTKMRDDAWEDLVDWDSNRIDPHIRDTR